VILIDTNLLLYATIEQLPQHERSRRWLSEQFAVGSRVGLPWHSLLGFVRLISNRSKFKNGRSVNEAWFIARTWLAQSNAWVPAPTERHAEVINDLLSGTAVTSSKVMDIHLAALAIEHGLTVCSNDGDFGRFPNVRWMNPLDA
jgi:toxin-antitoxin system PIN domain toxin